MKIVVGIPCMGSIHVGVVGSLWQLQANYTDIEFKLYLVGNSLVYDARNEILNYAMRENADYLLFIDSDIIFPSYALKNLLDQNRAMISGIYWSRSENVRKPIIYSEIKPRHIFRRIPKIDHVTGQIQGCTEIKACGMGFCLIRKDLIQKITKKFVSPFEPFKGMGEDISFCYRVGKIREKIYALDVGLEHVGDKRYKGV
jgi:glycosyltransferase involved in cell wall biosynthesis